MAVGGARFHARAVSGMALRVGRLVMNGSAMK